jgi:hypothetical protein
MSEMWKRPLAIVLVGVGLAAMLAVVWLAAAVIL